MTGDVGLDAPVLAIDYHPDRTIWPCRDCLPWHAEMVIDDFSGLISIREWHAVGCPVFEG